MHRKLKKNQTKQKNPKRTLKDQKRNNSFSRSNKKNNIQKNKTLQTQQKKSNEKENNNHNIDFSAITQNIFIGTNLCCQEHFEKSLLTQGILADISLEEEKVDSPFGVEYYLWLPVKDCKAPSERQLLLSVHTLKFFDKQGIKVYVHCKNGHTRAPTVVAAYLISLGKTTQEAIKFIKEKRITSHPTEDQIRALKEFEKKYFSVEK